jgi:hypothetical protein
MSFSFRASFLLTASFPFRAAQEDAECPLCLEEMDISDLNFKPCICGYQVRFAVFIAPQAAHLVSSSSRYAASAGTISRRT